MNDVLNDGSAGDDNALFDAAVAPSNEGGSAEITTQQEPSPAPSEPQGQAPAAITAPEPAIPPARLREEAAARREAERERDEMRGRLAAYEQAQRPPQQPQVAPEIWDDPNGAIRHVVGPQFEQFNQMFLAQARELAEVRHTPEKVSQAEQAFIAAMNSRTLDPTDYQRVVNSPNRFAAAVQWHQRQTVLSEVGNDPAAYRTRILEEAAKDPAFQKRVMEAARGIAQQTGNVVNRSVPNTPSLGRIGASAMPTGQAQDDVSDDELFQSTTGRRRA